MIYVALLRGINVGTGRKVDMKLLKSLCESLGLKDVTTYINSGNVLFRSTKEPAKITAELETAITRATDLEVKVLIRDLDDIQKLIDESDSAWENDASYKTDVMFLWPEIDNKMVLETIGYKPETEMMKYVPGAIFWHVDRKNVTKSKVLKMIGTPLYKQMTIRNINTLRKLHTLMLAMKDTA